jgi:two-component system, NtrC family, response regulator HydG
MEIDSYWRRIINTMNDALMIIGKGGDILSVNRSFEEMTGYSSAEVAGKSCTMLKCDACEKAINNDGDGWCKLFDAEREGTIRRCRCHIVRKDGTWLPALKNASVLYDEDGSVLGAVETLTDISEIDRLDRKVAFLSRQLDETDGYCGLIGRSDAMRNVFGIVEKAADSDAPVVVYGETGTGKELVARAIHERGARRAGPYVQVNCAALNESLLESELFGHIKGSFTGAYRDRKGRFETANGGTLFLDEIGDIPFSIQVKLLRALETKRFERVGEDHPVSVNVRIVTATNRNLVELISQNKFREDLYFRINVLPIRLPPLRERKDDIPLLVNTFVHRLKERSGKRIDGVRREALDMLMNYPWPGNVRELKSVLEYAFTVADQNLIGRGHFPPDISGSAGGASTGRASSPKDCKDPKNPKDPNDAKERRELIDALEQAGGNRTMAASILGVSRVTVWNRMRKHGINLKTELDVSPN